MTRKEEEFVHGILCQVLECFDAQRAYFDDAKKTGVKGKNNPLFQQSVDKEKALIERAKKGKLYYEAKWKLEPFNVK